MKASLFGLLAGRVTFVVDREGLVRMAFESQLRVRDHVGEALGVVREVAAGR